MITDLSILSQNIQDGKSVYQRILTLGIINRAFCVAVDERNRYNRYGAGNAHAQEHLWNIEWNLLGSEEKAGKEQPAKTNEVSEL